MGYEAVGVVGIIQDKSGFKKLLVPNLKERQYFRDCAVG